LLQLIVDIRPYLETAYFVAGIALAVGLLFARAQLKAFQVDTRIRNERTAKEKAVEACRFYLVEHMMTEKLFYDAKRVKKLHNYVGNTGNFTVSSLSDSQKAHGLALMGVEELRQTLNELEIICSLFVSGVADEKTGFQIIGRSLVNSIETNYDVITLFRDDNKFQPYWYNIVELYQVWKARFEREILKGSVDQIQEKLKNTPDVKITPIGGEN